METTRSTFPSLSRKREDAVSRGEPGLQPIVRGEPVTSTTSLMLRLSRCQASTTGNQSVSTSRYPVRGQRKQLLRRRGQRRFERKGEILCLRAQITWPGGRCSCSIADTRKKNEERKMGEETDDEKG